MGPTSGKKNGKPGVVYKVRAEPWPPIIWVSASRYIPPPPQKKRLKLLHILKIIPLTHVQENFLQDRDAHCIVLTTEGHPQNNAESPTLTSLPFATKSLPKLDYTCFLTYLSSTSRKPSFIVVVQPPTYSL